MDTRSNSGFRSFIGTCWLLALLGLLISAIPAAAGFLSKEDAIEAVGETISLGETAYGRPFDRPTRIRAAEIGTDLLNSHVDDIGRFRSPTSETVIIHLIQQLNNYRRMASGRVYEARYDHVRQCHICNAIAREVFSVLFRRQDLVLPFIPRSSHNMLFNTRGQFFYRGYYRPVFYCHRDHQWEFRYGRDQIPLFRGYTYYLTR